MKYCKSACLIAFILVSINLLNGCSDSDQKKAKQTAVQFIEQVKRKLPFKDEAEPAKQASAITYEASELKSPFRAVIAQQKRTGPMVLINTPINDIRIIGIVMRQDKKWAIVSNNGKQLHAISTGFHLGKESAKVKNITSNSVELEINPGNDQANSSIVTLKLQE